jgi:hypothetical protein
MYKNKYAHTGTKTNDGRPGRPVNRDMWITGPDPIRRDKYYAYLNHKAQAKYRNETYQLEFEDWERLWTDENWHQRGRKLDNLLLCRWEWDEGWTVENVRVCPKREYHKQMKKTGRKSHSHNVQ